MIDPEGTNSKIAGIRERIIGVESQLPQLIAAIFTVLNEAGEIVREAQAEIRRRDFRTYREKQAAEVLQISGDTMSRLRKNELIPCLRIGSGLVRYTDEHLVRIAQVLERPERRAQSGQKKGR